MIINRSKLKGGKEVISMSETGTSKEECRFCFTALAYLMGGCPVCGGTGFVEIKTPEREAPAGVGASGPRQSVRLSLPPSAGRPWRIGGRGELRPPSRLLTPAGAPQLKRQRKPFQGLKGNGHDDERVH